MTRSALKHEAKKQLSNNFSVLILTILLLGLVMILPNLIQSFGIFSLFTALKSAKNLEAFFVSWNRITSNPTFTAYSYILSLTTTAVLVLSPALKLGVHNVYLKATTEEKPHFSEMFGKMPQFGEVFVANLLMNTFIILQLLLLIVPGIIASYSYAMTYFVLLEHPELSAMEAIKESKRIMKGHKFDLFILRLSFFWWHLLILATFGLAAIYVIPYIKMAETNFYNEIKNK